MNLFTANMGENIHSTERKLLTKAGLGSLGLALSDHCSKYFESALTQPLVTSIAFPFMAINKPSLKLPKSLMCPRN
ncbi:hypothetical protein PTKIN_Ptkin02bG0129900 [Pterospermum kingtungense]